MENIFKIILIFLLLYIIYFIYLLVTYRNKLYIKTKNTPSREGFWLNKTTWVESRSAKKDRALIFFGSNVEEMWADIEMLKTEFPKNAIYFIHYRGYGKSKDKPSQKTLFSDAIELYDKISSIHDSINLIGRGLGTGVALYLASQRGINKLVLITPFDSLIDIAKSKYSIYPIKTFISDKYENIKYAKNIKVRPLLILANSDHIVPHENSYKLVKEFNLTPNIITIKNTNHINIMDSLDIYDIIKSYLH